MRTRLELPTRFALVGSFLALLAGCGGGSGSSATAPTPPTGLLPGEVTPVERQSYVLAVCEAGSDGRDVQEDIFGREALSVDAFARTYSVSTSGDNGIGRSATANATVSQSSTFVGDTQKISAWTFVGSTSYAIGIGAGTAETGDVGASGRGDTTLDLAFRAEEPGLLLVIDADYVVSGESFCVDVWVQGADDDWELDVCDEIGEGSFSVTDTLELDAGEVYEVRAGTRSFVGRRSTDDAAVESASSTSLDVEFQILRRPEVE